MRVYIQFGFVLTAIISGLVLNSQSINKADLELRIDSLIPESVNDTTPGLVVGVVENGELIFSKGYGLANLAYGIPNEPKMVYNIGSVSKQFLGYAFAILHVNGDVDIDDPVGKYLEDWPEFEKEVTLRHLLTHTSGYREAYTMSNLSGRFVGVDRLTRDECLNVVRKQPELEFDPGSRWTYNSTAWVILAEVFEKVTGESADTWVENNMLKPLGMNSTQIESYVGEVIMNAAESYTYDDDEGYANQNSNRAIFGAAEVYTSLEDLVKWINNYKTAEIGGEKVKDLFLDPFILTDGTNSEYALGINNSTYRGLKRYRHTGGHEAFISQLSYYPDQDLGIIVISNYGGRGSMNSSGIADILLEEFFSVEETDQFKTAKVKKKKVQSYAGLYLASTYNGTLDLTMAGDTLSIEGETLLLPSSDNTFRIEGWSGEIQFEEKEDGNMQLTVVDGATYTYNRVEKWSPEISELSQFEGDYWSEEIEALYHLSVKEDKLVVNHRWLGEITLSPVSNDLFESDWGYTVRFIREGNEKLSGLSIYSNRTSKVFFERKQ